MVSTLVLVRHGKAERGGPGIPDIERALTEKGHAALTGADGFPAAFARLGEEDRAAAEVWVSPALRARQTAQHIVEVIGERPLHEHECLWEQEAGAFLEELAASDARCVIAVGHIPFMDELLTWLTDEDELAFSPGSVAAIRMDAQEGPADAARLGGTLLWFARAPKA